jgi:hypothetical protein
MLRLLIELRTPLVGVVENMERGAQGAVAELARTAGVAFVGSLPTDPTLEAAFGDPDRLVATPLARALASMAVSSADAGELFSGE